MSDAWENTSGRGREAILPDSLRGWNWGAFLLNWIWGISHGTFIGLLMFIPPLFLVVPFVMGANGNRWAWANRPWRDVAHFRRVQRNWSLAGLVLVALTALGAGGLYYTVDSLFKHSEAYTLAVERVQESPRAIEALGQPIEAGWLVTGSITTSGADGEAVLAFPVDGPKASGMVYVGAVREAGQWRLVELVLHIPADNHRIDLLSAGELARAHQTIEQGRNVLQGKLRSMGFSPSGLARTRKRLL